MKLTDMFLAQLDAEAPRTRRALEAVPEQPDWKPHDKSMSLGRLAMLVARMPSWFPMVIERDDLDLAGSNVDRNPLRTSAELVEAHEQAVADARRALKATTDELLMKPWRLRLSGRVVSEDPKHIVVRDTFAHLAHHRGQLTVYLRLNDAPVPAIYGPSADDQRFL
jgi:uncharacterized damage-inducible protein DinB